MRGAEINLDRSGKRATGVTYRRHAAARNGSSRPTSCVLCAYQLFNVQLLLLSGIGKPYDRAPSRA